MLLQTRLLALLSLLAAMALGVAACGAGGGSGSMAMTSPTGQAQMRLSVSDAPPADNAMHVVVVFTGVELTANGGNPVTINFTAPKSIDLMTQGGTASAVLFDQPIPPGSYGQIRLLVEADGSANNSYVDFADGSRMGLRVPSGAQTGLKLVSGFSVPNSGVVDYTIDFDLRKAITCPPGQAPACILKPVERLVNSTAVGNIQGQIRSTLPSGCAPGVYLYGGVVTKPEDMDSTLTADANQPLASKSPVANSMPPYYYQFTFLPPGSYTVAFTCHAAQDNPDQLDPSVVVLTPVATAAVTAGQTTTVDIAFGAILGQVASSAVPMGCTPGVYLYSGNVAAPEDWNAMAPPTDANQPLSSMLPVATSMPAYAYQFTALSPGTYTLALTCQAAQDNPAQPDAAVTFGPVKSSIVVTADQATTANIP